MTDVKEIIELIDSPTKSEIEFITKAYEFAKEKHGDQKRYSGDLYFTHPFEVAKYIAKIGMAPNMIAAALLHDTVEDLDVPPETIEEEFNKDVSLLVEGVTKLGKVRYRGMKRHTESLRKLFAATSEDVRVMIIKLLDRLHNARTLEHVPEAKRERIALETIEIYAQIADRLGMGVVKRELEDAVFPFAYPEDYEDIREKFKEAGGEDLKKLDKIHKSIKKKLAEYGIKNFTTSTRVKGLYSFYKKLGRKGGDVNRIRDVWALRIVLPTVADCYTVMGVIHAEWKPMPGRIKDYIAFPKPNGYQSIHTTIHTGDGGMLEVQIRTKPMHKEAQYGIASHIGYKETAHKNNNKKTQSSSGMDWIKQFIPHILLPSTNKNNDDGKQPTFTKTGTPEWIKHMAENKRKENPDEYIENIKTDFFSHRMFVFTPKGDVIDLPIESTAIDFAYAIHSHIGHHISGVKINGKMSSLDSVLHNGDIIEIITSKQARPTRKWIDYAKTNMAKRFIRTYLAHSHKNK